MDMVLKLLRLFSEQLGVTTYDGLNGSLGCSPGDIASKYEAAFRSHVKSVVIVVVGKRLWLVTEPIQIARTITSDDDINAVLRVPDNVWTGLRMKLPDIDVTAVVD